MNDIALSTGEVSSSPGSNHPVCRLLRAALHALREVENKSELAQRRFLLEWLDSVHRQPPFCEVPEEMMALRKLLGTNLHHPVAGTLTTLVAQSERAERCALFRFRAAFNSLRAAGWRPRLCPWPEQIFDETLALAGQGKKFVMQLTSTQSCFASNGTMTAPVTLQLVSPRRYDDPRVEEIFHDEGFQVVTASETECGIGGREMLIRTLFIGHHTLPEEQWGPVESWQPAGVKNSLH